METLFSLIYKVIKLNCWYRFIIYCCPFITLMICFSPKRWNHFAFPALFLYIILFISGYRPCQWRTRFLVMIQKFFNYDGSFSSCNDKTYDRFLFILFSFCSLVPLQKPSLLLEELHRNMPSWLLSCPAYTVQRLRHKKWIQGKLNGLNFNFFGLPLFALSLCPQAWFLITMIPWIALRLQ